MMLVALVEELINVPDFRYYAIELHLFWQKKKTKEKNYSPYPTMQASQFLPKFFRNLYPYAMASFHKAKHETLFSQNHMKNKQED